MATPLAGHLEKLHYFIQIAESGSFAEAARKLRLAQPTLSQSMHILEDTLDKKLFYRASSGITLTLEGQIFLSYAQEILQKTEGITQVLKNRERLQMKTLVVGTKEPYAILLWPRYLKYLEGLFPGIEIEFRIGKTNDLLVKWLQAEQVDLIMIPNPPEKQEITSFELFRDRFQFYSPPGGGEGRPIYTFMGAMTGTKRNVGEVLRHQKPKQRFVDVDSFNVAKVFVANGLGNVLMLESFAADLVVNGMIRCLKLPDVDLSQFGTLKVCISVLSKYSREARLKSIGRALLRFHR